MGPLPRHNAQHGISLIAVMVALGVAGILAAVIATMTSNGLNGAKSAEDRQDIASLKMTLRTRLSCNQTLGVTGVPITPLSCPVSPIIPRDNSGASLAHLGDWTISVNCTGKQLVLRASNPRTDPLTKKPLNSLKTSSSTTVAQDLYGGTSGFCADYFVNPTNPCPSGKSPTGFPLGTSFRYFSLGRDATGQPACNAVTFTMPMVATAPCPGLARMWNGLGTTWKCQGYAGGYGCPAGWHALSGGINCGIPWNSPPCAQHTLLLGVNHVDGETGWSGGCYILYNPAPGPYQCLGLPASYADGVAFTCVNDVP